MCKWSLISQVKNLLNCVLRKQAFEECLSDVGRFSTDVKGLKKNEDGSGMLISLPLAQTWEEEGRGCHLSSPSHSHPKVENRPCHDLHRHLAQFIQRCVTVFLVPCNNSKDGGKEVTRAMSREVPAL